MRLSEINGYGEYNSPEPPHCPSFSPPIHLALCVSPRILTRHSHREGQGFILVYSIASRQTFERLEVFRQLMLRVKRNKPIFVLVGNKCDRTYDREVSREEGAALARSFGCEFLETSAKTAHNVEKLFMNLVRALRQTKQLEQGPPGNTRPDGGRKRKCCIM
jgi:GTPase KRas protein